MMMVLKDNGPSTDEQHHSQARQNWKKLFAVRKFISLAQTTQKKAPAELIIGGRFKIGKKIANGAFGQLRLVKNIQTGDDLAVKLEPVNSKIPQLFLEYEFYKKLGEDHSLPKIYYYGKCGRYNAMVLDLLGPNLEDLFNLCGRRFSTKTVLMIGIQLMYRIEKIHDHGLIYRDVKPENFLVGRTARMKENVIHIVDYGLAKPYIDSETKRHVAYAEHRSITGTVRYMSIHAHQGVEQSRRDDMEAIGYMLVYFMKGGKLPWMGLKIDEIRERYKMIGHKKEEINTTKLCAGIHREFGTYLRYIKTLKFTDKPDYNYLRNLFRNCLLTNKWSEDDVFDWMNLRSFQPSPTNLNTPTDKARPMTGYSQRSREMNRAKEETGTLSKEPQIVINEPVEKLEPHNGQDIEKPPRTSHSFGNIESSMAHSGILCSPCVSVTVSDFEDDGKSQEDSACSDGLQQNLSASRKSVFIRPKSPRPTPIPSNCGEQTAPGSEGKDNGSSCCESSDHTLNELTFDETSTSEEMMKPIPVQNIITVESAAPEPETVCVRVTPNSKHQFQPLGADYLSFRENVFYGIADSSNINSKNTNMISSKSGAVDLARPHCACFPFRKYWNWGKHKNQ